MEDDEHHAISRIAEDRNDVGIRPGILTNGIECADTMEVSILPNVHRRKRRHQPSQHSSSNHDLNAHPNSQSLSETTTFLRIDDSTDDKRQCTNKSRLASLSPSAESQSPPLPATVQPPRSPSNPYSVGELDADLRSIVAKYVRSDLAINCLELAGFTTSYVIAALDLDKLTKMEQYVAHTCSLMNNVTDRETFLGPIFCRNPDRFRFPTGVAVGLLMAASEIKQLIIRQTATTLTARGEININKSVTTTTSTVNTQFGNDCPTGDMICQMDGASEDRMNGLVMNNLDDAARKPSPVSCPNIPSLVPSSENAVSNVQAATQVSNSSGAVPCDQSATVSSGISTIATPAAEISSNVLSGQASSGWTNQGTQSATNALLAVTTQPITNNKPFLSLNAFPPYSNSNFIQSEASDEIVDIERLKQHSSASAARLASRQFVDAHLIRGRDFDMEMETSVVHGVKRVTGIFYCHLCREKRERTSAVRFSIARNRYPVLSNVLSHLKTHFQYRGPLPPSLSPSTLHHRILSSSQAPGVDFESSAVNNSASLPVFASNLPPSGDFGGESSPQNSFVIGQRTALTKQEAVEAEHISQDQDFESRRDFPSNLIMDPVTMDVFPSRHTSITIRQNGDRVSSSTAVDRPSVSSQFVQQSSNLHPVASPQS